MDIGTGLLKPGGLTQRVEFYGFPKIRSGLVKSFKQVVDISGYGINGKKYDPMALIDWA